MAVKTILAQRKDAIVKEWLARTLQSYPDHTVRFLARERDAFRNPVGHIYADGLPALFDHLLGDADAVTIEAVLDRIIRLRAVQDFTPSQAIAFILVLKKIVREELPGEDLAALEEKIDQMALLAFDVFMKCREESYEIKAREARRGRYLMERMQSARRDGSG